ncbi:MAG TPA: redoxin domain-containing protein [Candidatus Hydrogenedentes bacterium]|nr:redoxin domain-containing protein [Candidatus Hydrogenedentota bacterium]HIJ74939.1 redoxin domain-containing protein [Candidatus Hydrogenedentota bacterium]
MSSLRRVERFAQHRTNRLRLQNSKRGVLPDYSRATGGRRKFGCQGLPIMQHFLFALFLGLGSIAYAFELSGVVVDPQGEPVPDAGVWAAQDRVAHATQTDAHGKFAFDGLTMRPVDVVAQKAGFAIGGYSALGVVDSGTVEIQLGEPEPLRLRIIDETLAEVSGARIKRMVVNDTFHVWVDELTALGFRSVRSDDTGLLAIPDAPKGGYVECVVYHRKYAETHEPYLPVGREQPLDVLLYSGVALRGRVTNEAGEGVPTARVSVFLMPAEGNPRVFGEGLTDEEGFYKLILRPRRYYLAVYHADYPIPRPREIILADDGSQAPVDVVLPTPRSVRGRVLFLDDAPARAVRVAYMVGAVVYAETLTTSEGYFDLKVAPGEGSIRVLPPPGYITEIGDIGVSIGDQYDVRLGTPVRLKPLPEIVGTVIAARRGPQPNCLISSLDLDPPYWAITDEEGGFRIQLREMPEQRNVRFRAEHGRHFLRKVFDIDVGNAKPVKVKLKPFDPDLGPCLKARAGNDLSRRVGEPAPEIHCKEWLNTSPLALEDLRGKVVVMTLWAGFDKGPSKKRMAELNALHRLFADEDDVFFLGIHEASASTEEVREYVREFGIDFAVGVDADPFITFEVYQTNLIPQTVLIDKKGVVRFYDVEGRLLELIKHLRLEP